MFRFCCVFTLTLACLTSLVRDIPAEQDSQTILSRVAFGSSVHQDKPQAIWEAIASSKPDLFLFCGDNIYADVKKKGEIDKFQKCYDKLAAQPGYQKLLKTCPLLATWADH